MRYLVSGARVFQLKATHGLPLDFTLDRIINQGGHAVAWVGFVEEARKNGWWDFQTFQVIEEGMEDAQLPRDMQQAIKDRLKVYMLAHPLKH